MADGLKVFIVGSARSGTSITYFAMREVFGIVGVVFATAEKRDAVAASSVAARATSFRYFNG